MLASARSALRWPRNEEPFQSQGGVTMSRYIKHTSFYSFSLQSLRGLKVAVEDLLNLKTVSTATRLHLFDVLRSVKVALKDKVADERRQRRLANA